LYKITVDAKGVQYLGMTILHDKQAFTMSISMPGYVDNVLTRFHEWAGQRKASSSSIYHAPQYGSKMQYATTDNTGPLTFADVKTLLEIVGNMLYYARAFDPAILTTTNTIASEQANPTGAVHTKAVRFLQYAAAYPDHIVTYVKPKMQLHPGRRVVSVTMAASGEVACCRNQSNFWR
jgi:hypothetical protein